MCPFKIIGKWSEPTTSGVSYVMPMRMCQYCALRKIIIYALSLRSFVYMMMYGIATLIPLSCTKYGG